MEVEVKVQQAEEGRRAKEVKIARADGVKIVPLFAF